MPDITNYGHTHGGCSTSGNTNIRMPNGARTLSITRKWPKTSFGIMKKLYSRVFPVYDKPKETGHYTKDMTLRPLRRYFKARKGKPELELKFYPEGGKPRLRNGLQRCPGTQYGDGEHLENVEIDILDPQGRKITKTRTGNRGRCTFLLEQRWDPRRVQGRFPIQRIRL